MRNTCVCLLDKNRRRPNIAPAMSRMGAMGGNNGGAPGSDDDGGGCVAAAAAAATAAAAAPATAAPVPAATRDSRTTAARDLVRMADGACGRGRYGEAIQYYHEAIRLAPSNAEAISGLGRALVEIERYDEAHRCFRAVLEASPDHPVAHAGMGDLCMRLLQFGHAVAAYDRSLASSAASSTNTLVKKEAHTRRGEALMHLGRHKEALRSFVAALRIDGDDVSSLYQAAECHMAMGRPRDAIPYYRRVCALSLPMKAHALHQTGRCLALLGRHADAIAKFESALECDEDDWDSALGIGQSLAALKRHDAALDHLDRVADDGPDHIACEALAHKSRILDGVGRGDDAIAACDKAIEIGGVQLTEVLLRKGRILARSGRRLAALACIAAARYEDPHHTHAARDATVVIRALARSGGLPWMPSSTSPSNNGGGGARNGAGGGTGKRRATTPSASAATAAALETRLGRRGGRDGGAGGGGKGGDRGSDEGGGVARGNGSAKDGRKRAAGGGRADGAKGKGRERKGREGGGGKGRNKGSGMGGDAPGAKRPSP